MPRNSKSTNLNRNRLNTGENSLKKYSVWISNDASVFLPRREVGFLNLNDCFVLYLLKCQVRVVHKTTTLWKTIVTRDKNDADKDYTTVPL
jgi:hypothetical protein